MPRRQIEPIHVAVVDRREHALACQAAAVRDDVTVLVVRWAVHEESHGRPWPGVAIP